MGVRRLLRKLRLRFRRPPRSAGDLIDDYQEYLRLQREVYRSHESEVERWAQGQRRFVTLAFAGAPPSWRVLDCGCGDGVGLETLRSLGFREPVGVELSGVKAARARERGFQVEELDMHDLSLFEDGSFQAVLSSHTLEHAYQPARALAELRRLLVPGGPLKVVLPYPDPGSRNELAHAAKYELGLHRFDGGESATRFFQERGFELEERRFDSAREPEIWLFLKKCAATPSRGAPAPLRPL
jgi:SAM-dependent methyltransferase